MLTVASVLRSGGDFDASWVEKLKNGVARNLTIPHRFVCISDCDVPCERIPIEVDWPRWWPKILLFKPGVITGPTVYFDLDVLIVRNIDDIARIPVDFSMMDSFLEPGMVNSSILWFGSAKSVPHHVYTKFSKMPDCYMEHHERRAEGVYVGDQAFVYDALGPDIERVNDHFDGIYGYKYHCSQRLPADAKVVMFSGNPRPSEVDVEWVKQNWR